MFWSSGPQPYQLCGPAVVTAAVRGGGEGEGTVPYEQLAHAAPFAQAVGMHAFCSHKWSFAHAHRLVRHLGGPGPQKPGPQLGDPFWKIPGWGMMFQRAGATAGNAHLQVPHIMWSQAIYCLRWHQKDHAQVHRLLTEYPMSCFSFGVNNIIPDSCRERFTWFSSLW